MLRGQGEIEREGAFSKTINKMTCGLNRPCGATSGLSVAVNGEIAKKTQKKTCEIKNQLPLSAFWECFPSLPTVPGSVGDLSSAPLLVTSRQQAHTGELG